MHDIYQGAWYRRYLCPESRPTDLYDLGQEDRDLSDVCTSVLVSKSDHRTYLVGGKGAVLCRMDGVILIQGLVSRPCGVLAVCTHRSIVEQIAA